MQNKTFFSYCLNKLYGKIVPESLHCYAIALSSKLVYLK